MIKAEKRKQKRFKRSRQKARDPLKNVIGHWPPQKADLVSEDDRIRFIAKKYFEVYQRRNDFSLTDVQILLQEFRDYLESIIKENNKVFEKSIWR